MAVYCGNYKKNTNNSEKMAEFFILKHIVHIVVSGRACGAYGGGYRSAQGVGGEA
jgi:hypothetical protein